MRQNVRSVFSAQFLGQSVVGFTQPFLPGLDLGIVTQHGAALPLCQAPPHPERGAGIQGIGKAFDTHRAAEANRANLALGSSLNEKLIWGDIRAQSLRGPRLVSID